MTPEEAMRVVMGDFHENSLQREIRKHQEELRRRIQQPILDARQVVLGDAWRRIQQPILDARQVVLGDAWRRIQQPVLARNTVGDRGVSSQPQREDPAKKTKKKQLGKHDCKVDRQTDLGGLVRFLINAYPQKTGVDGEFLSAVGGRSFANKLIKFGIDEGALSWDKNGKPKNKTRIKACIQTPVFIEVDTTYKSFVQSVIYWVSKMD